MSACRVHCIFILAAIVVTLSTAFSAHAIQNGSPLDKDMLAYAPYLGNVVRIEAVGKVGTGLYLGDGLVLTAAHVLMADSLVGLRAASFPAKFSYTLKLISGETVTLASEDYDVLLNPDADTNQTQGFLNGPPRLTDDSALIKITNPRLLAELKNLPKIPWADSNASRSDQLVTLGQSFDFATFYVSAAAETLAYAAPLGKGRTIPGDSGGPVFRLDHDQHLRLLGVMSANILAADGTRSGQLLIQTTTLQKIQTFLDPTKPEWLAFSGNRIAKRAEAVSGEALEALLTKVGKSTGRGTRLSQARQEIVGELRALFYWTISESEALDIAKVITAPLMTRGYSNPIELKQILNTYFSEKYPAQKSAMTCESAFQII